MVVFPALSKPKTKILASLSPKYENSLLKNTPIRHLRREARVHDARVHVSLRTDNSEKARSAFVSFEKADSSVQVSNALSTPRNVYDQVSNTMLIISRIVRSKNTGDDGIFRSTVGVEATWSPTAARAPFSKVMLFPKAHGLFEERVYHDFIGNALLPRARSSRRRAFDEWSEPCLECTARPRARPRAFSRAFSRRRDHAHLSLPSCARRLSR